MADAVKEYVKYLGMPSAINIYRRRLSYYQALFCKYLHLQYNAFVIYDESKRSLRGHPIHAEA